MGVRGSTSASDFIVGAGAPGGVSGPAAIVHPLQLSAQTGMRKSDFSEVPARHRRCARKTSANGYAIVIAPFYNLPPIMGSTFCHIHPKLMLVWRMPLRSIPANR
jgi:hypothetical protein